MATESKPDWEAQLQRIERSFDAAYADEFVRLLEQCCDSDSLTMIRTFIPPRITLSIVADNSSLLSILWSRLKYGSKSFVLELVRQGIVRLWAPARQLDDDLDGKFAAFSKRLKIPVEEIDRIWRDEIAKHVILDARGATPEVERLLHGIRERDVNDVEYVSLALLIEADGVTTTDPHLLQEDSIRIMKFTEVTRIASLIKRGRLASVFQVQVGMMGVAAVALLYFMVTKGSAIAWNLIQRIPPKVWLGIALVTGVAMLFPGVRTWTKNHIEEFRLGLWAKLRNLQTAANELVVMWGPVLAALPQATNDLERLREDMPRLGKAKRRPASLPADLEEKIVAYVRSESRPLRPSQVVHKLFPNVRACNLSRIRHQVGRVLARHTDITKVGRGLYTRRQLASL